MALGDALSSARADEFAFFGGTETLPGYGAYSSVDGSMPLPVYEYDLNGSFVDASAWDDYSAAYDPTSDLFAPRAPGAGDIVDIGGLPAGFETPIEGPAMSGGPNEQIYGYYGGGASVGGAAGYDGGNGFQISGVGGTIADLNVGGPGNMGLGDLTATNSATISAVGGIPLLEYIPGYPYATGAFTENGYAPAVLTVTGGSITTPSLTLTCGTSLSAGFGGDANTTPDPVADAGSLIFNGSSLSGDITHVCGILPSTAAGTFEYNAQPVVLNGSELEADTELDIIGMDPDMYPNATGTTTLIADSSAIAAGAVVIGTGTTGYGSGDLGASAALILKDGSELVATNTGDDNTPSLVIGDTGSGTLCASEGSTITSEKTVIGNDEFSSGSATIDASMWTNNGALIVGDYGDGTLTITDGSVVSSGDTVYVGLGDGSNGTLAISDGASLTTEVSDTDEGSDSTVVGGLEGSNGIISIDGAQSLLESKGDMTVGSYGTATVTITNGAGLIVDGEFLRIGQAEGGNGFLGVLGTSSYLTAANATLNIGESGTGTLVVNGGATLSVGTTDIGSEATGVGTLLVYDSGSQANLGDTTVGDDGLATLSATGGAIVNVGDIVVGEQEEGSGTLYISDANTQLTASGDLTVGGAGLGLLIVTGDASLTTQDMVVGRDDGSAGTANITAAGTNLHVNGDMTIGQYGQGNVGVNQGAGLQIDGDLTLGQNQGAEGTLTIDGANTTFIFGDGAVAIGSAGSGMMTAQNGAVVDLSGNDVTIGDEETGNGTLTITDAGTIFNTGELTVGNSGAGTVNIIGGGALTVDGDLNIGSQPMSNGEVNIGNSGSAGSASVTGSVYVGGNSEGAGGSGTLSISGGTLTVGGILHVWPTGTLSISGGSLTITSGLINDGNIIISGGSAIPTTIGGVGILTVDGAANFTATRIRQSSLTISSGSTVTIADSAAPGTTTATSVLSSLTNNGTLDLKNNDLIINDPTQLSAVRAVIASAYNSGAWNGSGITSSSAAAKPTSYGLGYATTAELANPSTFDGQNVSGGAVIVKYTLLGDTLLRGTVGGGDYNTVLRNFDSQSADWSQGNFHNATTGNEVSGADFNAVLANFDATASGSVAQSSLKAALKSAKVSAAVAPAGSANDIVLNVNTITGDVSMQATTTMGLTLYNIVDASKTLIKTAALLISKASTNWQVIKNTSSILAEGQNSTTYNATSPSSFDTIQLTAGQSIDLGDVFNVTSGVKDLTFEFSEPNVNGGDPTTGTTYDGAAVNYVPVPEPTTLGLLGLGGLAMMRRRRKTLARSRNNA
jgi:T5SS/PEP-CTERM-associated repeat protein